MAKRALISRLPEGSLRNVITGLGALYLASAITHFLIHPHLTAAPVVLLVGVTAATIWVLRWVMGRFELNEHLLETMSAVIAMLAILTGAVHLYFLTDFSQTTNLALLGIGLTCYFLSARRMALVVVVTLCIWMVVAWTAQPTEAWLHFTFGLLAAAGLRVHSELRRSTLENALAVAQTELQTREAAERRLRESEERFALASKASADGLWDWDVRSGQIHYSPGWKAMLGYLEIELSADPDEWFSRVHAEELALVQDQIRALQSRKSAKMECDYRVLHKKGFYVWVHATALALWDEEGEAYRIVGSQRDISSRKANEEKLYFDAVHDPLTQLANRNLLLDRLQSAMKRRRRDPSQKFAVLFVDLDYFKVINDTLGHVAGDQLLQSVGKRMRKTVRELDTVARFGGDEFVVLLDPVKDPAEASRLAHRILERIRRPFEISGREAQMDASIGITLNEKGHEDPVSILRDADVAMYRAKTMGRGRVALSDELDDRRVTASVRLEGELPRALARDELELHFEPVFALQGGYIAGLEAQLKWKHPVEGLLEWQDFGDSAERAGLTEELLDWMLGSLSEKLVELERKDIALSSLQIGLDLFGALLNRGDVDAELTPLLKRHGEWPTAIGLEIAEKDLISLSPEGFQDLKKLRKLGYQVSLDQFGAGMLSLRQLRELEATQVKLDRSVAAEIVKDPVMREVASVMVNLAHDLHMKVVALGVEDERQAEMLTAIGCDFCQGSFYSRPVHSDDVVPFLKTDIHLSKEDAGQKAFKQAGYSGSLHI